MKHNLFFCSLLLLALAACTPQQQTPQQLVYGADVSDAFCTDRLPLIDSAFQRYVDIGVMPHAVTMIVHNGRVVHNKAFGWRDKEAGIPCQTDDIFRIASQTKAISVVALMTLFEEGLFQLDEPIKKYLPEFSNPQVLVSYDIVKEKAGKSKDQMLWEKMVNVVTRPALRDITIRHLITHTSGICYDGVFDLLLKQAGVAGHNTLDTLTLAENVKRIAEVPLKHDPGEAFTYSYNIDVLGRLAEVLTGKDFYTIIKERVLDPCDMHDTYFHVPANKRDRVVTLYSFRRDASDAEATTLPHDSGYYGDPRGRLIRSDNELYQTFPYASAGTFCSPSAGLCGTIEDYAKFCQMILNDGMFNNRRIIGRKTLEMMQKNGVGNMRGEIGFGMAWDVFTPENAHNTIVSEGSMRWGGMFGTDYIIDPQENLIVLMYVNNMPNLSGYNPKTLMHNVTYQALR